MTFNLDGYTTVAERILDFYKQYPAGVITTHPAKTIELGSSLFVSVIARIYLDRHMDDAPVTEAEAWEPYPGKTPYTRDSEMMNAATSAIGRALMQLGIGITQAGAASADEIRVAQERRSEVPAHKDARYSQAKGSVSDKQMGFLMGLARKKGFTSLEDVLAAAGIAGILPETAPDDLNSGQASTVIDWLKQLLDTERQDEKDDMWGGKPW